MPVWQALRTTRSVPIRFSPETSIAVNPNTHFLRRNLRLEGIWGSRHNHFVRGLTILERNEYPYADLVSHVLPLEGVADGFDALNGTYQLDGETVVKIAVSGAA